MPKKLNEGRTGSLQPDVTKALPSTWILPQLTNQDAYHQYRMGLALAAAAGNAAEEKIPEFETTSPFGENMIISAYSKGEEEIFKRALTLLGKWKEHKLISTPKSEEANDVFKVSPIPSKTSKSKVQESIFSTLTKISKK